LSPDERSDIRDHANTAPDIAALIRATKRRRASEPDRRPVQAQSEEIKARYGKIFGV